MQSEGSEFIFHNVDLAETFRFHIQYFFHFLFISVVFQFLVLVSYIALILNAPDSKCDSLETFNIHQSARFMKMYCIYNRLDFRIRFSKNFSSLKFSIREELVSYLSSNIWNSFDGNFVHFSLNEFMLQFIEQRYLLNDNQKC